MALPAGWHTEGQDGWADGYGQCMHDTDGIPSNSLDVRSGYDDPYLYSSGSPDHWTIPQHSKLACSFRAWSLASWIPAWETHKHEKNMWPKEHRLIKPNLNLT